MIESCVICSGENFLSLSFVIFPLLPTKVPVSTCENIIFVARQLEIRFVLSGLPRTTLHKRSPDERPSTV